MLLKNLKKYEVILASNSPRRRELLIRAGIKFRVFTLFGIDESFPVDLKKEEIALHIVTKKATAYKDVIKGNQLIITADTIVCTGECVLGKPNNAEEAKKMLRQLSGKEHTVITAIAVSTKERFVTESVATKVVFADLSDDEIEYYVRNYLPFDKAGGYGIQEWIGLIAVTEIQGSFFNVIGLPVQQLYRILQTF